MLLLCIGHIQENLEDELVQEALRKVIVLNIVYIDALTSMHRAGICGNTHGKLRRI